MENIQVNGVNVKIWAHEVEDSAMSQIENLTRLPFVFRHIAVMPDVHAGMGMPIGGVLATRDVVVPNAVGVDIGCGMCAVKTNVKAADITSEILRKKILRGVRRQIPLGMTHHKKAQGEEYMPQSFDVDALTVVSRQYASALRQVGTLGGGNHFVEFQRDDEGWLWIMIHSGSRNLGKQVGDYYNKLARTLNERWYSTAGVDAHLPFLAFGSREFDDYWSEMSYCIEFAYCNRRLMMQRIMEVVGDAIAGVEFEPMINIAHNYAAWEQHYGESVIVHRKGATLACEGVVGIIPGSQGTNSYIVEGLGNRESYCSSSHGAGRVMSRTQAVNTLSLDDEIARLDAKGIVHAIRNRSDLEEAAGAYKDIDEVMACQTDLVKIKTRLSPVAVIKG